MREDNVHIRGSTNPLCGYRWAFYSVESFSGSWLFKVNLGGRVKSSIACLIGVRNICSA